MTFNRFWMSLQNWQISRKGHKMNDSFQTTCDQILVFTLDELVYALPLSIVVRVIQAVEIRHLPKASEMVMGVVSFHGEIIPVINIRKRFSLPVREIELENQFIILQTAKQHVGLVVDSVIGIHDLEHYQLVSKEKAFPYTDYVSGIAKVENSIVLILDEQKVMDEALSTIEK